MAGTSQTARAGATQTARRRATPVIRRDRYGTPADLIAPEDFIPEPDECGAGLSGPSILWWPLVDRAED